MKSYFLHQLLAIRGWVLHRHVIFGYFTWKLYVCTLFSDAFFTSLKRAGLLWEEVMPHTSVHQSEFSNT